MSVMSLNKNIGRKQALKQLRTVGKEFISDFLTVYADALTLRSKEPGLCWKAGGRVAYVTLVEFSGPNSTDNDAPLLFRIRMNLYPPPAIFYHLRSPKVRHKLGVSDKPMLLDEPTLELTAMPDEVGKYGRWLPSWLDNYVFNKPSVTQPPVETVAMSTNEDLSESLEDIMSLGQDWRRKNYLWTPTAVNTWKSFIQG